MVLAEIVQQRRKVAEGALPRVQAVVVQKRHNAGDRRRRAARPANVLRRPVVHNLEPSRKRRNVGVRAARLVEKLGVRCNAAREVGSDGVRLERRLLKHVREAAAARAPRRLLVREKGDGRATHRRNVRAAGGPVWHKHARRAPDARVARGKEDRAAAHAQLLELNVSTLNVRRVDRALDVAVADRVDPRGRRRVEDCRCPVEEVLLAVVGEPRLRDEPCGHVASRGLDVLDVELRLHARVVGVVGTDDDVHVAHSKAVVLLELGKVRWAVVLLEESGDGLRRLGVRRDGARKVVRRVDRRRRRLHLVIVVDLALGNVRQALEGREVAEAKNHVHVLGNRRGQLKVQRANGAAARRVLEVRKLGVEHAAGEGDRRRLRHDIVLREGVRKLLYAVRRKKRRHRRHRLVRRAHACRDLLRRQVLAVLLGAGIRDSPKLLLEPVEILLLERKRERDLLVLIGGSHGRPADGDVAAAQGKGRAGRRKHERCKNNVRAHFQSLSAVRTAGSKRRDGEPSPKHEHKRTRLQPIASSTRRIYMLPMYSALI
eukprot:Opistho-1_new@5515